MQLSVGNSRTADLFPRLPLRIAPTLASRILRITATDIDFDTAHIDIGAGDDGRNAPITFHLCARHAIIRKQGKQHCTAYSGKS